MNEKKKDVLKIILPLAILISIDLLVKSWVSNNLSLGERIDIFGDTFTLVRVESRAMQFQKFIGGFSILEISGWIIKILFLVIFIRAWKKDVSTVLRLSLSLILFGIIGNLLDRFIFMNEWGDSYRSLSYFYDRLTDRHTSISSTLSSLGLITSIGFLIIRFKEFKGIFQSKNSKRLEP